MKNIASCSSRPPRWSRWCDSPLGTCFIHSPLVMLAAIITLVSLSAALGAPWIAPHDPFNLATLELSDSRLPPAWMDGGQIRYWLGTDDQGRDIVSALMHGLRISLFVGLSSVLISMALGVTLGLWAGFWGGLVDTLIMRVCDVMMSFPAILIALLIDGVGRAVFPQAHEPLTFAVLILAISLTGWVQYARVVRSSTMVERQKDYVQAAQITGVAPWRIMRCHVLPNVMGPVWVLATVQIATAIMAEATLSFLGVGVPPTTPSLGSLIRVGHDFLFSGEWWISFFPGAMLVLFTLSINLLGDGLREALDPRWR